MPVHTRLTELLKISSPIIQAPMAGGGDTVALVAAVCNAGALGSIGAAYLSPEEIIERGKAVRQVTSRPFGINLFAPLPVPAVDDAQLARATEAIAPYYAELGLPVPLLSRAAAWGFEDQFAACMEIGAAVFSFTFGSLPATTIATARKRGMLVMGTATTVEEAKVLVEAGVDAIVGQGSEAGGHRGSFATPFENGLIGSISLIPQIVDAISVPVVASGSMMDGRGIAAALALGASAVQMGTAFLCCDEAGIPDAYKQAILSANEDQTQITRAFSGRPARGIANRLQLALANMEGAILPFPLQNALTRPLRTESAKRNRADYLSLWAGQGTRMARRQPAAELIAQLNRELFDVLRGLQAQVTE